MKNSIPFDILRYREIVQQRVSKLETVYQRCFAIWCLQAILDLYHCCDVHSLSEENIQFIENAVDILKKGVITSTPPSTEQMSYIVHRCHDIDVEAHDGLLDNILLIQLLGGVLAAIEVYSDENYRHVVMLAEYAINCVDAIVSDRTGVSPQGDLSSVPEIADELNKQEKMICYLENSPVLVADDITRYRKL